MVKFRHFRNSGLPLIRPSFVSIFHSGKVDVDSLLNRNDHTSWLHPPPDLSTNDITSLLLSIVSSVSNLEAPPTTDTKLTDMGVTSFDIVRIANQVEVELFGSHDHHMTMLVELLLESDISQAAEYISKEISLCSSRNDDTRKRILETDSNALRASKKPRNLYSEVGSHAGHVTVESWRRGQYFINGK